MHDRVSFIRHLLSKTHIAALAHIRPIRERRAIARVVQPESTILVLFQERASRIYPS
jgi:hypothetical protein